jgi:hypothetical protein
MKEQFQIIDLAQQNMIKLLDSLSIEQINRVPEGFNNNLIWNFAHVVASLQMLCYVRGGMQMRLDENFVNAYKIGTKPEAFVTAEEYERFKQLAADGLNKLKEDYANNFFRDFKPFTTATGVSMATIEFVITYVCLHHGNHQGWCIALKKLVTQTEKV